MIRIVGSLVSSVRSEIYVIGNSSVSSMVMLNGVSMNRVNSIWVVLWLIRIVSVCLLIL